MRMADTCPAASWSRKAPLRSCVAVAAVSLLLSVICLEHAPFLCIAQSPSEQDAAARLQAAAGEGFRVRETDHFLIAYDTPYSAVRPLVGRLEGTYKALVRFCQTCGIGAGGSDVRLEVILFAQHDDFVRHLESVGIRSGTMAGIYDQRSNIAAFCDMLDHPDLRIVARQIEQTQGQLQRLTHQRSKSRGVQSRRRELQHKLSVLQSQRDTIVKMFNRFVIQHEAAHQMFFNLGVHVRGADNPTWLVEGLACQFEVPQTGSDGNRLHINHMRLGDFRDALGLALGEKQLGEGAYQEALRSGRFVPLVELISKPELFSGSGKNLPSRYAQAWALVYYLHDEHREKFAGYVTRVRGRLPGQRIESEREIEEFQAVFGMPDEQFQRAWIDHILALRYDPAEAGR